MIAIQTIFHTGIYSFLFIPEAVKIDMVNLFLMPVFIVEIFVNDRKSRTGYDILYIQEIANCVDEGGFPGSHISMKSNDRCTCGNFPKGFGCLWQLLDGIDHLHKQM